MSYVIPDPRWEMPELLTPGRKPVGNVVIDWTHPLTKGLAACYIFQANSGDVCVDLVSCKITKLHNSASIDKDGVFLDNVTNVTDCPTINKIDGNSKFTFMFRGKYRQILTNAGLFSYRKLSTLGNLFLVYPTDSTGGNGLRVFFAGTNTAINQNTDLNHADGLSHDISIIGWNGSETLTAYIDNSQTIAGSASGERFLDSSPTDLSIGGWNAAAQSAPDSTLEHLFIFDHNLAEAHIRSLHKDPYQFLIPA